MTFVPTLDALERPEPKRTIEPTDIAPIDPRFDPALFPKVPAVEVVMPSDEVTPPLVIMDYMVDPAEPLFEGVDTSEGPHFTVSEAAKFFFRRSSHWIRLQENLCVKCRQPWRTRDPNECPAGGGPHDIGLIRRNGQKVADRRTEGGARYYTLSDIEQMARALYEHRVINDHQLSFALSIARMQGRLWDYIELRGGNVDGQHRALQPA